MTELSHQVSVALDLLRGGTRWCKGTLKNVSGQHCTLGALAYASQSIRDVPMLYTVAEVVCETYPERVTTPYGPVTAKYPRDVITTFNDHPETTFDDVRVVLEKSRARLEEDGA